MAITLKTVKQLDKLTTVPTSVDVIVNDSNGVTKRAQLSDVLTLDNLPAGALERLVTVANQAARFALTISDVQLGDTVQQLDTGVMYVVVDTSKLSSADGYKEYTAGTATKAASDESGNNIKASYGADLSISDHTLTLKNKNGANLKSVTVPDNNTTYTMGTSGNTVTLTPSSGTAQSITVPYATSAGSATSATSATTATKLGSSTVGGTTTPIYLNGGTPTALGYTIAKSVPSDAKFSDTWTAMVGATSSADGSVGYVNATPPKDGYNTKYLRADGTWAAPSGSYSLPLAASGTRGGIQIGYTQSGKNYPVQLSSEKAYVNVPWTDTTTGTSYNAGSCPDNTTFATNGSVKNTYDDITSRVFEEVSDSSPYLFRKGKGNLADIVLEGYSLPVNQLIPAKTDTTTNSGLTYAGDSNGGIRITGTSSGSFCNLNYESGVNKFIKNHVYYVRDISKDSPSIYGQMYSGSTRIMNNIVDGVIKITDNLDQNQSYIRLYVPTTTNSIDVTLKPNMIDLTQRFGSDIADHIYSKEQASAGSGLAWIKSFGFFSKDYEPFNLGSIQSVKPSGRKVVEFNLFDDVLEYGSLDANGQPISSDNTVRTKNFILCVPNTDYYYFNGSNSGFVYCFYDASGNFISTGNRETNGIFTSPSNAWLMKFRTFAAYGRVNKHDICINISNTAKNGTYEPYTSTTVALPNEDLRGILLRDGDNLYAVGDTDDGSGKSSVRFGHSDLGTLTWENHTYNNVLYFKTSSLLATIKPAASQSTKANAVCAKYEISTSGNVLEKSLAIGDGGLIYVRDSTYDDAAAFKTAMSGVYLDYELATPTTESSTPWQNPQRVFADGTEQFIDTRDVPLPVGHTSVYQLNETLPPIEDYVDSSVAMLQANFQDGVDTIVDAIEAKGVTLSGSTPTDCATGVNSILTTIMEYIGNKIGILYPGSYPTISNVESAIDDTYDAGYNEAEAATWESYPYYIRFFGTDANRDYIYGIDATDITAITILSASQNMGNTGSYHQNEIRVFEYLTYDISSNRSPYAHGQIVNSTSITYTTNLPLTITLDSRTKGLGFIWNSGSSTLYGTPTIVFTATKTANHKT